MKPLLLLLALALSTAARAQLTAPAANTSIATTSLTDRPEYVHVFFDDNPIVLHAAAADTSSFTWYRLNVADTTLDLVRFDDSLTLSVLNDIEEGGYQVVVRNLIDTTAPIDTLTTWTFRDTFRITGITLRENTCNELQLTFTSLPHFNSTYLMYHFHDFLYTESHAGDVVFHGSERAEVTWSADRDIHEGVDDPDENWKTTQSNTYLYIDAPPPLYDAIYTVVAKDVFGKSSTYTLPEAIPAMAAYSKITAKEWVKGVETSLDNIAAQPPTDKEALYEIQFSHEKSLNAQKFYWKGYGSSAQAYTRNMVVWSDSTTNPLQWIVPRMPYKGGIVNGYTPGSYSVRLTVHNLETGCSDSTKTPLPIGVKPSNFGADAIPNAFTPNGDGQNDVFRFVIDREPVSMEYVHIYIFSRSGALVYRYEGRVDAWEGWNGRLMNTGSDVADGIYYYVINGEGWDDVLYNTAEYKGALHIFR
jgi:gliding motility-associated-like protein